MAKEDSGPALSARMPAQQDATLASRMPAQMKSDAPALAGEGGLDDAPVVPIRRDSSQNDPEWESINDMGEKWQTSDKKTGPSDGYSVADRKETDSGGLPQRDPDNDGDLN